MKARFSILFFLFVFFQHKGVSQNIQWSPTDTVLANKLLDEGKELGRQGKYKEMYPKVDSARQIYESIFPQGSKNTGVAFRLTGRSLLRTGEPERAKYFMQKAAPLYDKYFGGTDPQTAGLSFEIGNCIMALGDYEPALAPFHKALEIYLLKEKDNIAMLPTLYGNIAICYYNTKRVETAIEFVKKSIAIQETQSSSKGMATNVHNLANFYYAVGQHALAEETYKKALDLCKINGEEKMLTAGYIWTNLGNVQVAKGNFRAGLESQIKGYEIKKNAPDYKYPLALVTSLKHIGDTYRTASDYQNAIQFHSKALADMLALSSDAHKELSQIYYSLGVDYKYTKEYSKAIPFLEKAASYGKLSDLETEILALQALGNLYLQIYQIEKAHTYFQTAFDLDNSSTNKNPGAHPSILLGLGTCFMPANFDRATEMFRKGVAATEKKWGEQHTETAIAKLDYARALLKYGHLADASRQLDSVLIALNWHKNADLGDLNRVVLTMSAMGEKAHLLLKKYATAPSPELLNESLALTIEFDRLFSVLHSAYTNRGSIVTLGAYSKDGFDNAIKLCRTLHENSDSTHYFHNAFLYAEKTKSLLLYEGTQEAKALHFSGIPDTLLAQEYNLRVDIAYYDQKRFELENKGAAPTDSALLALSSRAFDLRQQFESLKKTFETDYPDYYRLKYDLRVEDVAAVQRDLLYPDMALVEYFVGDSAVYIFTIGKKDYSVLEVKKDFPLEQWVAQLRRGMTAFHTDADMAVQYDTLAALYTEAASNIYEKLVAPIAAKLPAKVIFIPDGVLGYVPFEALLVEKPANPTRWSQHHYLLNDHSVSYCYSATMLREMLYRRHKQQPTLNFLGFAPHYNGDTTLLDSLFQYDDNMRKDLRPLPYSGEEVFRGAKMMKGQAFIGGEASKSAFTENASRARILHLATHGQANDRAGDYCFLVFADPADSAQHELLYARDIYNLQLNADLVTLSACETGIGELQGGEGIISLARAFAYAGAKSIVTSLWSVSDAKTKDLMLDFYKNLRKGMLKDDALRQAKLDFLKRNRGQAAHPFYWAGFVGIGNMGKMR